MRPFSRLIAAAILAYGAQEAMANRASGEQKFRSAFFSLILTPRLASLEAEYACSTLCGIAFGLGLVFFGYFVLHR